MKPVKTINFWLSGVLFLLSCSSQVQVQSLPDPDVDNLKISLPSSVELWSGWRQDLPLTIENPYALNKTVALYALTPVNIFFNGRTSTPGRENQPVEVMRLTVPAGQTLQTSLEIQSLRLGEYPVKFIWGTNDTSLMVTSKPLQRGACFMYRCWFEASEFFYNVWSDGQEILTGKERKSKISAFGREDVASGVNRQVAEKRAAQKVFEEYPPSGYRQMPNWQQAYDRKKFQRTETYGYQYADVDGLGWGAVELKRGEYDWSIADFMVDLNQRYFKMEPVVRLEINPQWVDYVKGPEGRRGFFDARDEALLKRWEEYCQAVAERYDGDGQDDAPGSPVINHYTLMNEPEAYWLNVDFEADGWPISSFDVTQTRWWKEAEAQGREGAQAFTEKFGDLVLAVTRRAAEAIHRANPKARVSTPQFVAMVQHTAPFMNYLLEKGLGRYVDAWGIHPGNELFRLWQNNPAVQWWVEDATNQAPPFDFADFATVKGGLDRRGQIMPTARPIDQLKAEYLYIGKIWRKLIDESFSRQLEILNRQFAEHDLDLPFWSNEQLTIGPLATNRRENLIAALREYSIIFHQKTEITVSAGWIDEKTQSGSTPVGYLPDAIAKELIIDIAQALGGSKPVEKFDCRWFASQPDRFLDYRWAVYKLFNRGPEDIIALWSNSTKNETFDFALNSNANLRKFKIIKYDAEARTFRQELKLSEFPNTLTVKPLQEFYFISVTSDQPNFGWLSGLKRRGPAGEAELSALWDQVARQVEEAKVKGQRQRDSETARRARFVPQFLNEAEMALMNGDLTTAQQKLEQIQNFLSQL